MCCRVIAIFLFATILQWYCQVLGMMIPCCCPVHDIAMCVRVVCCCCRRGGPNYNLPTRGASQATTWQLLNLPGIPPVEFIIVHVESMCKHRPPHHPSPSRWRRPPPPLSSTSENVIVDEFRQHHHHHRTTISIIIIIIIIITLPTNNATSARCLERWVLGE